MQIGQIIRQSATQPSRSTSPTNSQALELQRKYPYGINLLQAFNPSLQAACERNHDRCFTGTAPRLATVRQAYNQRIAETWIEIQLNDLSEFSGVKDKLTVEQIQEIASVILGNYPFLNLAELMLFFRQFKAGIYGQFFGAVDGLVITSALHKFVAYRERQLARIRQEQDEAQLAAEKSRHQREAISYDDYCRQNGVEPNPQVRELLASQQAVIINNR